MKRALLLFIFFTNTFCFSQIINIPDPAFKSILLQSTSTNLIAGGVKIDQNDNGQIEQNEALLVYTLILPPGNISDLTGIAYFTNVMYLTCSNNQVVSANLSTLTKLEIIDIGANQLTSLDLNGLTHLYYILCGDNQLTQLDFSTLTALKVVICDYNLFTVLDFSNNPLFDELACTYCPNLTTLKIKNNKQQIFTQTFYNGCWDNNPNLTTICADANEVVPLQNFLINCGITQPITIVTDCALSNEEYVDNTFAVYPNPSNGVVFFDNTLSNYKTVSVYNYLGQEVLNKKVESSFNKNLDLSILEKGIYILRFSNGNELKSVKVSKD